MKTAAHQLADYVTTFKYEDLPQATLNHAKLCLLDAICVGLASTEKPWSHAALDFARHQGGNPHATVWLHGDKVPDVNAALVNAVFVHSMDFNDDLAGIQVGGVIPTTALAVGESVGASGQDILAAIILGYDVATRTAMAMNSQGLYLRGLQPTAVCGSFVAAAVAGRLLKLDSDQLLNAFGIAGSYAGGTIEFLEAGSDTKRYHVAKAAQGGIVSAHLAKRGMTGPKTIFEGNFGVLKAYSGSNDAARLAEELGQRFDILQTSFKKYPFCDGNAAPLEAAIQITRDNGIAIDDIESINFRIKTFLIPYTIDYFGDRVRKFRPQNELDAQMSLPYCVAVGLRNGGTVKLSDFDAEQLGNPETLKLADRMTAEADAELDKIPLLPMSMPSICTLTTKDGRSFEARVDYQKGDPRNPFTLNEFREKFDTCLRELLPESQGAEIFQAGMALESQADIRAFVRLLVRKG
ncbi:MAG: MmgE/PrpD family protein [Rhizobiales bacterium]|nr:MmgE/PrpD family protein [Hyphomicrobiales bacterium]